MKIGERILRKRIRDYGLKIGLLPTGIHNSITDVPELKVGHATLKNDLDSNEAIISGVTAIIPHSGNLFYEKIPVASFILNGFSKTTGLIQVEELGVLESPIMLTNTLSVPAVTEGTLTFMLDQNKDIGEKDGTINIVVGECNDSYLNDIRGLHVRQQHAIEALKNAKSTKVEEGGVGAGAGMTCFGWKGGIGSSSRIVDTYKNTYTVGTMVLSNFGLPYELTILGNNIGKFIQPSYKEKPDDGSIIIIVATDAPLDSRQLKRLAKRASLGLARVGSIAHNGSGDIIIAFSNSNKIPHNSLNEHLQISMITDSGSTMTNLFQAVVESVEESIYNSLFMAKTTVGRHGRKREELPIEEVLEILSHKKD